MWEVLGVGGRAGWTEETMKWHLDFKLLPGCCVKLRLLRINGRNRQTLQYRKLLQWSRWERMEVLLGRLQHPWWRSLLKVVAHPAVLAEVPRVNSYIFLEKPFLKTFIVSNKSIRKFWKPTSEHFTCGRLVWKAIANGTRNTRIPLFLRAKVYSLKFLFIWQLNSNFQ